jgi:hypothetical protein
MRLINFVGTFLLISRFRICFISVLSYAALRSIEYFNFAAELKAVTKNRISSFFLQTFYTTSTIKSA